MSFRAFISMFVAVLYALPASAGELKGLNTFQTAKYSEDNVFLQRKQDVAPRVKITEKYDYYTIDGATSDELRGQMRRNGTKWNDGKVYAALTTWDIRYDYDIASIDGRYYLKSIKTDIDIVYHLPRLVPSAKTPEQLVALWKVYIDKLTMHEVGHRDISVRTAEEIYTTLASIGSFASRSDLDNEAKRVVKAKLQRLKEVQVDYDADTHHGETQGAVLTPFPAV